MEDFTRIECALLTRKGWNSADRKDYAMAFKYNKETGFCQTGLIGDPYPGDLATGPSDPQQDGTYVIQDCLTKSKHWVLDYWRPVSNKQILNCVFR